MYRLRFVVGLFAIALVMGGWLGAQDKPDKVKGILPQNWGKLGLSDEQKQKVYKIQSDYKQKTESLRKQLKELDDQERGELQKVLTDDQKARLRKLLEEKSGIDPAKPEVKDKKPDEKDKQ